MKNDKSSIPTKTWFARTPVLHWMVPLAFGVMIAGFVISIIIRSGGWPSCWDDLILSNLASRQGNPNGWLVAVVSETLGGTLLLASAALFIGAFRQLRSGWGTLGALIFCLGILAIIIWAISTPLTEGYSTFHANLSYFAYMSSTFGLGICHTVIAFMPAKGRLLSSESGLLLMGTFFFIIYLFFHDEIFDHTWFLAVMEWVVGILIASTTVTLSFAVVRLTNLRKDAN